MTVFKGPVIKNWRSNKAETVHIPTFFSGSKSPFSGIFTGLRKTAFLPDIEVNQSEKCR
jgi:hypothetical protein